MKVTWQVNDGYVGGRRPHVTEIDESELEDLEGEERQAAIDDIIKEDFDQRITWEILSVEDD
jgi:hypothetical protein